VSDTDALYQDIILDHNRRPRNHHPLEGDARQAAGRNPLCGDEVTVWLRLDGDRIAEASFVGRGCAISKAAASLMTTAVEGRTRDEAERLFDRFHDVVTGKIPPAEARTLGTALAVFSGVARFPVRVKCASLPWHAMRAALHDASAPVTTDHATGPTSAERSDGSVTGASAGDARRPGH
jgi:nitrogen fixation NifU-like protein